MTPDEFFTAVLRGLGMEPTAWRLAAFKAWARMEGMPFATTWNPLATTRLSSNTRLNLSYNIGYGAGNWNSVPVRVYASPQDGITATIETLALSYYEDIRRCLREQTVYLDITLDDFATYVGSEAYGRALLTEWAEMDESKGQSAAASLQDVIAILGGDAQVLEWKSRGNDLLEGYTKEQAEQAALKARQERLLERMQESLALMQEGIALLQDAA